MLFGKEGVFVPEIRKAEKEMERELKTLWRLLYPEDSAEYIDLFFRNRFLPEETAVVLEGDRICGVMYMLPCVLSGGKKAFYAYAGGIRPEYRGRGYFRLLIETLARKCTMRNAALFLVPGENLWDFYRSAGFRREFRRKTLVIEPKSCGEEIAILPCTAKEYAAMRTGLPKETPLWDVPALEYAAKEAAFGGGGMIRIKGGGIDGTALVTKRENDILLQETTLTAAELHFASGTLCRAWKVPRLCAHLSAEEKAGDAELSGLMLGEGVSPGHLALTLIY